MIVPESGVILAEDANDIDQWNPDCMMDMIVELIAAVVTLALDSPPALWSMLKMARRRSQ
jgi:hypothetical protein